MDAQWAGVVGALGGVIVTAISGIVGVIVTVRNQRLTIERQLANDEGKRLREERRSAFVDYQQAYQNFYGRILALADGRLRAIESGGDPAAIKVEDEAPVEAAHFSRTYHSLAITAGPATREAAHTATSLIWDLAEAAASTTNRAEFEEIKDRIRPSRHHVRDCMRAELGIE